MAKVWKAYIKKHGDIPENETDLMIFSKKCRTVQTLTQKQALKAYNKHKNKHIKQEKNTKKKKKIKKRAQTESALKYKRDNTKMTKKKGNKDTKNSKSLKKDKNKPQNKDKNPLKKDKNKLFKFKKKRKKKDKENLIPSKYHRRRTSTNEHLKKAKTKEKTNKIPEALPDEEPQTQSDDNTDIKETETNDVDHIKQEPDFPTVLDDDDDDNDDAGVISKSPNMSSALAMFQKLSSFDDSLSLKSKSLSPRAFVKKKGKRYYDFREFANGAFSIVYKAKDKENNDDIVAVKKIHIGGSLLDGKFEPTTKEEGDNEVRILKLMNNHYNTCNLVDTYFDMQLGVNSGYVLCIVMEYMQYTLKERIEYYGDKGDCIPMSLIKVYSFQMCKAINYMHIKNILHRDIKPENVLLNATTNRIQLCDFGCSLVIGLNEYNNDEEYKYEDQRPDGNEPYVMSRFYRAPECILGNRYYDCSADIWSLGVVIAEMFLGMIVFMGSTNMDQLREIILKLGWPTKQQLLAMNPNIDKFDEIDGIYGLDSENALGESWSMIFCGVFDMEEEAIDFISKLLIYSPKKRLPLLQCLSHSYFEQVKDLMNKSNKKKKEDNVPSDLFVWNDIETKYAKSKKTKLPM